MLADVPERRTQREELKIRVSAVRFCPWPLTTKHRQAKTSSKNVEQKRRATSTAVARRRPKTRVTRRASDGNRDVLRLVDRYVSGRQYVSDETSLRIFHRPEPSAGPAGGCRLRGHLGTGSRQRRAELG